MHRTLILLLLLVGCFAIPVRSQPVAPHGMFLRQPVPADGTEPALNAPILRWPYLKGRGVRYELELSPDRLFLDSRTIRATGLTGAIFHPHRRLEIGHWFWRHRVAGQAWSPTRQFIVTPSALPNAAPEASVFLSGIPKTHPRLLSNGRGSLAMPDASGALARQIISDGAAAAAEGLLTEDMAHPTKNGVDASQQKKLRQDAVVYLGDRLQHRISVMCQADRLTGSDHHRLQAVRQALLTASWDPDGVSGSSDFTDGACMKSMALVLDTYYDRLIPSERDSLVAAVARRVGRFYQDWVNNIESKVLSGHVWQLILHEFFQASLALHGHHPAADEWLAYAYELFLSRMPVLGGIDGGWTEGAYYFTMNMEMLVDIPEKIREYTGYDHIHSHPWYREQSRWMIHHVPPGSMSDGFGDNTEDFMPGASYAAFAAVMHRHTGDARFAWYFNQMRSRSQLDLSNEPCLRWHRLLHGIDGQSVPMKTAPSIPLMEVFREAGLASVHTDPDRPDRDIMLSFRSGTIGAYGHILADQNTFNILAGGQRLFYRTGFKVAMDDPHRLGWSKHTKSQNGILIDGNGQPFTAESYGYLRARLQAGSLAYVAGDASGAYRSAESKEDHGMERFIRHVVFLRPGVVVIYDELTANRDAVWSWLIHSLENMRIDSVSGAFTSTVGGFVGHGRLWGSDPVRWNISNRFEVPAIGFRDLRGKLRTSYTDDQWHLKAVTAGRHRAMRFLSVIRVDSSGTKVPPIEGAVGTDGVFRVHVEGWEIRTMLPTDREALLEIRSSDGKTVFNALGGGILHRGKTFGADRPGLPQLLDLSGSSPRLVVGDRWEIPSIR